MKGFDEIAQLFSSNDMLAPAAAGLFLFVGPIIVHKLTRKSIKNVQRTKIVKTRWEGRELDLEESVPTFGLKEIFINAPSKPNSIVNSPADKKTNAIVNSPAAKRYSVRNMLDDIKAKLELIKEYENEIQDRLQFLFIYKEQLALLQKQLEAEEVLRKEAENESDLIQDEIDRLNKQLSRSNLEREGLRDQIKKIEEEIEIAKASKKDLEEPTSKINKMFTDTQNEVESYQEEINKLREDNRLLTQESARKKQRKDYLLAKLSSLKNKVEILSPKPETSSETEEESEEIIVRTPISTQWRTRASAQTYEFGFSEKLTPKKVNTVDSDSPYEEEMDQSDDSFYHSY